MCAHTYTNRYSVHACTREKCSNIRSTKTGRGRWSEALRTAQAINSTKIKQEIGTKHATVETNGPAYAMHSEQSLGTRMLLG